MNGGWVPAKTCPISEAWGDITVDVADDVQALIGMAAATAGRAVVAASVRQPRHTSTFIVPTHVTPEGAALALAVRRPYGDDRGVTIVGPHEAACWQFAAFLVDPLARFRWHLYVHACDVPMLCPHPLLRSTRVIDVNITTGPARLYLLSLAAPETRRLPWDVVRALEV